MNQITEYWLSPMDGYDDSIEVYYHQTEREALRDMEYRKDLHPNAAYWRLEKVVRVYRDDGEMASEIITEIPKEQW